MGMTKGPICPLCLELGQAFHLDRDGKQYHSCHTCSLVWLDPKHYLHYSEEQRHYETHNNDSNDPRYRRFLAQLWEPLRGRLPAGSCGLDFGSGPGPTLHLMAQEDGFPCAIYDPFFAPNESLLNDDYDFITCSEAVEHFFSPRREFLRMHAMLRPGGWLAIMTARLPKQGNFADWYYRRDPTHTCFYAEQTFFWIASAMRFETPLVHSDRVVLMRKR